MDVHSFIWILIFCSYTNGFLTGLNEKENIAANMTASQTTTLNDWTADRAVDGCTNQSGDSTCCSRTQPANDNEWTVEFGTQLTVGKIQIYGMFGAEDELAGFEIYFGSFIKNRLYTNEGKPYTDIIEIYTDPLIQTDMLTVRRRNDTVAKSLTICEFEAFEVCSSGLYGDTCMETCGNCLNAETCYGNTGKCPNGCTAGWRGDVCKTVCDEGTYGNGCMEQCGWCVNNEPCNITTGECLSDCETGWYGTMCKHKENIAFNMTATQTTTLSDWTADRAVDGCTNQSGDSTCCSRTQPANDNEWTVEFGTQLTVGKIQIYGMFGAEDELAGFEIYFGSFIKNRLYTNEGKPYTDMIEIYTDPPIQTDMFTVRRRNDTVAKSLTICEFEAFEVCSSGLYGDTCTETCGNCLNAETCYGNSGKCPNGCIVGWRGDVCKTVCTDGTYGNGCREQCGWCVNNEPCNIATGECMSDCETGWYGTMCKHKENIAFNMTATQTTTLSDWTADRAVDGCTNQNADSTCCIRTQPANDNTWTVEFGMQRTVGKIQIYGLVGAEDELAGFELYVGSFIKQLLYTNEGNPYTDMIEIYTDPPIQTDMFTVRRRNDTVAKSLTICEFEAFEVCPDGLYGDACMETCGNCINTDTCYGNTGKCPNGCTAGWKGDDCKTVCDHGTYGDDCSDQCGWCVNKESCHTTTGECSSGCETGWYGTMCKQKENIALKMTATQTTTLSDWTAGRAVDGCTNWSADSTCCSKTQPANDNTWTVDFGMQRNVGKIHLYGMIGAEDELAGFDLYFGSFFKQFLYTNEDKPYTDMIEIYTDPPIQTSMMTVRRRNDTVAKSLTICEFEAFEVCSDGLYGDICKETCGNCVNGETCFGNTGKCPNGCAPGWHGDICKSVCHDGTYGKDCSEQCGWCMNNEPCNKITGECPSGCETGWYGATCIQKENIALNMTAIQTTTLNDWTADRAVDGCTNQKADSTCCSKTQTANDNEWTVDFGMQRTVGKIQIYGMIEAEDELAGFEIYFGSVFKQFLYTNEGKSYTDMIQIYTDPPIQTDMMTVRRGNDTVSKSLTICEFEAFEVCPNGLYGDTCMETCGNCLNADTCYGNTGKCPNGCTVGWRGGDCKAECADGTFGANCESMCYCADRVPCNKTTGVCPAKCDVGFSGEFCEADLNRAKNKTATQSSVLSSNGFLWSPGLAVDGNFEQANSDLTRTCSATNPLFPSPHDWSVDMETTLRIDYVVVYGKTETSAELEGFNMYATNETGFAGKEPVYNSTGMEYGDGIYIANFSEMNEVILARYIYLVLDTTGSLSLCEVRVFGECPVGTFGEQCDGKCYCADGLACNEMSGECPVGGCQPGWTGSQCNMGCSNGTFGENCVSTCGNCMNDTICDAATGNCDAGCVDGFVEPLCASKSAQTREDTSDDNTAVLVGAIVGGIIGGLAVFVILVLACKYCKGRKSSESRKAMAYYPSNATTTSSVASIDNPAYEAIESSKQSYSVQISTKL